MFQSGLIVACYHGYQDVVIALSQCPYLDVNWQDNEGNTALITAAQAGKPTVGLWIDHLYVDCQFFLTSIDICCKQIKETIKANLLLTAILLVLVFLMMKGHRGRPAQIILIISLISSHSDCGSMYTLCLVETHLPVLILACILKWMTCLQFLPLYNQSNQIHFIYIAHIHKS